MPTKTDAERLTDAIAAFPETFGLRGFHGETFKISTQASYVSEAGAEPTLYTARWNAAGVWQDFAKGTAAELRAQLVAAPMLRWTYRTTGGGHYQSITIDHGIVDAKGRAVGGYAEVERARDERTWILRTLATRDGKQYGSSCPSGTTHATPADAMAAAEAALRAQGARVAKRLARRAGARS